jgi:acetylornithine deacetylase
MADNLRTVLSEVDRDDEACVDCLCKLIQGAEGGEEAIQRHVSARLAKMGCEVEVIRYAPRALPTRREYADSSVVAPGVHTSVVGKIPGTGAGRSLIVFAQGDTEAVVRAESWERPLFEGQVEDGRVFGWGAGDDLSGVAAMICGTEAVLNSGLRPKGDLILASTPSKNRARGITAVLDRGYEADGTVYVHPAESGEGLNEIKQATCGRISFKISIAGRLPPTGEPGHTAFHHLAVDPLEKAWVIYKALRGLGERRAGEVHHPVLDEAVGCSTNMNIAYLHYGTEDRLIRVSPHCVLAGTVTVPPGEDVRDVQSQISETVQEAADRDPWLSGHPPDLKYLVAINGAEVPLDHSLYRAVKESIKMVTGSEAHPNPLHTASDIRNPMLFKDIPTVGFGPIAGNLAQTGGHDEWVDLGTYLDTVKAVASVIVNWCGV